MISEKVWMPTRVVTRPMLWRGGYPLVEQGDLTTQVNLASMYRKVKGATQDYKTSVKWYNFSAEQGYVVAQYNLWRLYYLS